MMIGQSGPEDTRGHQSAEDNVAGHSGPSSGLSYLPDLLNISTSQVWYTVIVKVKMSDFAMSKKKEINKRL